MGAGGTFAVVTLVTGVLLLLGWFYGTSDNPRSGAMFGKSLYLFVVPILLAPSQLFTFPLGLWAWIACEEALKALGSTTEESSDNKFWFVLLFGIWELTVDKPFWGFDIARSDEVWGRLAMGGFLLATALPVLMHAVTAAIYAYAFNGRLWAAFIASWAVHTAFNETVSYFGLSLAAGIAEVAVLSVLLFGLLRFRRRVARTAEA